MKTSVLVPSERVIPYSPLLGNLFGVYGALLLQQIHFWVQRKPNSHGGHDWHYNTIEEWTRQIGGVSRETIKRTVASLERKGVLISAVLNKRGFDRTKWYRIDYPYLSQMVAQTGDLSHSIGSDCANGLDQTDPVEQVSLTQPIPKKNTEKIPLDENAPDGAGASKGEEIQGSQGEGTPEAQKIVPPKNASVVALHWKNKLAAIKGGYVKNLSGKETGQLKHVVQALGTEQTVVLVDLVLEKWFNFAVAVRTCKGVPAAPEPNCGYFCAHYDVAMNLLSKAKSTAKAPAPPAAKPAPKKHVEPPYVPPPEELEALFAALDAQSKGKSGVVSVAGCELKYG